MATPFPELLPEIQAGRCILFLGSGSSVSCESPHGGGLTGNGLKKAMLVHLEQDPETFPDTTLREASEFIESRPPLHRRDLDDFIYKRLRDLRPTVAHLLLTMFPWRAIVTTNFNQAIEQGYVDARERGLTSRTCHPILVDRDLANLTLSEDQVPLFKPHGCISRRGSTRTPMVLTPRDYYQSVPKRRKIYKQIRKLAQSFVTLFVGYSLDDYTFNNIYYELQDEFQQHHLHSYAVLPVDRQKAPYIERTFAERRITLIDDKSETFMLSLAEKAGLLKKRALEVAVDELQRAKVVENLGAYAESIPNVVRRRLAVA